MIFIHDIVIQGIEDKMVSLESRTSASLDRVEAMLSKFLSREDNEKS